MNKYLKKIIMHFAEPFIEDAIKQEREREKRNLSLYLDKIEEAARLLKKARGDVRQMYPGTKESLYVLKGVIECLRFDVHGSVIWRYVEHDRRKSQGAKINHQ